MNLFFLDRSVRKSVRFYSNQHVLKILLEAVQMAYAVHHRRSAQSVLATAPNGGYRATHRNHPMVRWAGDARSNYATVVCYAGWLLVEYGRRFAGKSHRCGPHVSWLLCHVPPFGPTEQLPTPIPLCMPEQYWPRDGGGDRYAHNRSQAVRAYRAYYRAEKQVFASGRRATWPEGERPPWLDVQ